MKLETAYRRLLGHRHLWKITIELNDDDGPTVSWEPRFATFGSTRLFSSLDGCAWSRGLVAAMASAADRLDEMDRLCTLETELLALANDLGLTLKTSK
jgi:hypothetical protein